ncbi:MAG: hypothetical protein AAGC62_16950, partial [Pseudomonadota bacterium]
GQTPIHTPLNPLAHALERGVDQLFAAESAVAIHIGRGEALTADLCDLIARDRIVAIRVKTVE